jgi:hypothetical protein
MAAPKHAPRYVQLGAEARSRLREIKWVLWDTAEYMHGPLVWWQLREFADGLGYDAPSWELHKFLKTEHLRLQPLEQDLGFDARWWRPSLLQASWDKTGTAVGRTPFLLHATMATTQCLLCLLVRWQVALVSKREAAEQMMQDLLLKTLGNMRKSLWEVMDFTPPACVPALCRRLGPHRACMHCQELEQHLATEPVELGSLRALLRNVYAVYHKTSCGYAGSWLKYLVLHSSGLMDDRLAANPEWPQGPGGKASLRGKKRRRRLDIEVFKVVAKRARLLRSTALVVKAGLVDATRHAPVEAEHKAMSTYLYALYDVVQSEQQLSLAWRARAWCLLPVLLGRGW